jgi:hypothetical protein
MKLGAEPKKVAALAVLLLLAAYFIYTNVFSSQPVPPASSAQRRTQAAPRKDAVPELGRPAPRPEVRSSTQSTQSTLQEFKPSLKLRKSGESGDLSSIDATLRLDLLAKLQEVRLGGGGRSLFEFSTPPPARTPEPKVIPKPLPPPDNPPEETRKPAPPRIPLKFFGFTTPFRQSSRRAFFLDGDEILVASEGDVLKRRYRVVRISEKSVVMEDLDYKAEQTLPLEPQVG